MLNNKKGFTLGEVLITVGLIGVLAAISIPSYVKYARSVKTAEAQSSLSQIYMSQKAFYLQWRFYTSDLLITGIAPEGSMLYNVGFTESSDTTPDTYRGSPKNSERYSFFKLCGKEFGEGTIKSCAFKTKIQGSSEEKGFTPVALSGSGCEAKATETDFVAVAIGDLLKRPDSSGNLQDSSIVHKDIWAINQYKQIENVKNGVSKGTSEETDCTIDIKGGGTSDDDTTT